MSTAADPDAILELAVEAARRAGEVLLDAYRSPPTGVAAKSTPTDLVSDADRAAERILLDMITARRPDDGIVSEEGGRERSTSGLTWVVDPLDGTINYLFHIPAWAVSVAVEDEAGALAGVVHHPLLDETFAALRDRGSTLNDDPIRVSDRSELSSALVGTGFAYDARARAEQARLLTRVLPVVRDVRRAGSAALDLSSVACGRLDAFYEAPMERWDKAAGVLLIREAGGVVTELPAPLGLSPGVVAGNRALHGKLRALVDG